MSVLARDIEKREMLIPPAPTKGNRFINYLVGSLLTVAFIAVGTLIYWGVADGNVLDIYNNPVPVDPMITKSEQEITLITSFCKHSGAKGVITRKLVSARTELLIPTTDDSTAPICIDKAKVKVPIPPQAVPDTYKVTYDIVYKINPLKTATESFESQQFQVVATEQEGTQGPQGVQGVQGVQGIQGPPSVAP